jgi:hypothetical protein
MRVRKAFGMVSDGEIGEVFLVDSMKGDELGVGGGGVKDDSIGGLGCRGRIGRLDIKKMNRCLSY